MPYTYAKQGSKYTVYKKKKGGERGEKVGSTEGTKEALKKYLAALHANETTNENMIPKWIVDIFKTKREKRDEQDQVDLDRYVADLRFTDPEKYERLQGILKHVDPDTGHLPTGLNTGNLDESKFNDIKASPNKFTNWRYNDPKNPSLARKIISKGRNANEAALYVAMRYPEYPNLNPQYLEDTGVVVSVIDRFVEAIYDGKTEAPERGQTPFFMKEIKNKLKKLVKELAADLPPTGVHAVAAKDEIKKAISSMDKNELINLSGFLSSKSGFQPKVKTVEDLRNKLLNSSDLVSRYFEVINGELVVKGSTPSSKQDVAYTGPGMRENVNENKNKMKVNQLKQIIREEIANVLKEGMDDSRFFDPFSPEYKERERGAVTRQLSQMTIELPSTERGAESGQYTIDQSRDSQKLASALMKIGNAGAGTISLDNLQSFADMFGSSDTFMNWLAQTDGMKFKVTMPRSGAIQLRKIA